MTDALTLYKLIILYMLDKVDFPLLIRSFQNLFLIKAIPIILSFSRRFQSFRMRNLFL